MFSSLQFSPWTNWVIGVTWGTIQHRSSSSLFCRRPLWAVPAWVGKSTLILSIQHFLPTLVSSTLNKVPWKMVLERLSWSVTHPNHASFHLLTVARRGSCGPARELILLHTQLLVLCSKLDCSEVQALGLERLDLFFFSESAGVNDLWSKFYSWDHGWLVKLYLSLLTF